MSEININRYPIYAFTLKVDNILGVQGAVILARTEQEAFNLLAEELHANYQEIEEVNDMSDWYVESVEPVHQTKVIWVASE